MTFGTIWHQFEFIWALFGTFGRHFWSFYVNRHDYGHHSEAKSRTEARQAVPTTILTPSPGSPRGRRRSISEQFCRNTAFVEPVLTLLRELDFQGFGASREPSLTTRKASRKGNTSKSALHLSAPPLLPPPDGPVCCTHRADGSAGPILKIP